MENKHTDSTDPGTPLDEGPGGLIPGDSAPPCGPAPIETDLPTSEQSTPENISEKNSTPSHRGRKPGVPNKITAEIKEMIMERGRPVQFLCDVARGVKIRVGAQAGPDKEYVYPDLPTRMAAAKILMPKLVADLKAIELTGDKDNPLSIHDNREPLSMTELARRTAFLLDLAARDGDDARRPAEPCGGVTAQAAGVVASPSSAAPASTTSAPEEAHEAAPEPDREPNVGETAVIGTYRIERRDPLRDGHPPEFALRRAQDSVPSLFFTGWPAALKWIMANVPEGTNLTPRIEQTPTFEPARPEQRATRHSPGPKIVGSYSHRKR